MRWSMDRRGEISMEVIIIAAIALLVLVILSVLILRSGTNVAGGTGCEGVGGRCADECSDLGTGWVRSVNSCSGDGQVCCVQLSNDDA